MIERALCQVLVSREEELVALEDALLAANRGEGGAVVLAGDAGMGKTRMATELRQRAEKLGCAVLWGGCSEAELALPYLPFLEAIGNYLAEQDIEELRERLGPARRELSQLFPQLSTGGVTAEAGDPVQAKLRLFEAILELLLIPARSRGVLLVIEDVHWADASTRELLDYMTRRVRTSRVMVLATYRRDEMHRKHPLLPTVQAWRRAGVARVIDLDDLSPDGVAAMVCAIFDEDSISPEFRDVMHQRSEGNPFVLEEMLKEALDRGDIFRTESGWDRRSIGELHIPETVRDTILLRVERLDPGQVDVLRFAAVLGADFDFPTLVEVSGLDDRQVESLLHTCVQEQLLEEDAAARGRYRFRHALTREAIYEDMTAPGRARLHLRAADALASRSTAAPAERALHLVAAGRAADAVPLLIAAAEDASRRLGHGEAAALYRRALPHIADPLERARVRCRLGEALWQASDLATARDYLEEGVAELAVLGETEQTAAYLVVLGRCRWELADSAGARADYERARDLLEPLGPSENLATAYVRLAGIHAFNGRGQAAVEAGERAVAVAEACGADAPRIWAYNFIGLGLDITEPGHEDEVIAYLDRSYREAEERGLSWIAGNALHNGNVIRYAHRRARECAPLIEALRRNPHARWRNMGYFDDATVAYNLGDLSHALAAFHEFADDPQTSGLNVRWARRGLTWTLTELGRLEDARAYLVSPDGGGDYQDVATDVGAWIRFHLAADEPERAEWAARILIKRTRDAGGDGVATRIWGWSLDCVVEALLAAGAMTEARQLVGEVEPEYFDSDPYYRLARARVALAADDATSARADLDATVEAFDACGYRLDLMRSLLLRAAAWEMQADVAAAVADFTRAAEVAVECGAVHLGGIARTELERLGVSKWRVEGSRMPSGEAVAAPDAIGERLVTVMFADVRGYTQMTAATSPSDLADRIATFQRWARQEIQRHHGLVDKFAGDAVMATFNASGASVDHCLHALQAGITLRDKAALMDLGLGIGIAVGPAIVGRMTADANVSVLGETTNLAARLQSAAGAGEVLISADAHRRVRAWLDERGIPGEPRGLELKGFDTPVTAHAIGIHGSSALD